MAQDYTEYLAASVLNEQQHVNYRMLSRALKVHSNLAKQMLYEFHRKQNAKKPSTVHATYLLIGTGRAETPAQTNGTHDHDGDDTVMRSSPPLPSSSAPKPEDDEDEHSSVRSVMLVKEEHLERAKSTFESITSIHIYSLQANRVADAQVLVECNRKVATSCASEDPLVAWKQYGTIQNPNARRRTRRTAPPPPPPAAKVSETKLKPSMSTAAAEAQPQKTELQTTSAKATPEPKTNGLNKLAAAKRQNSDILKSFAEKPKNESNKPAAPQRQSSDIFKSFAKGGSKPKKLDSQSSAEASPIPQVQDESMGGFSDDEGDDEMADGAEAELKLPSGKSKEERKAELEAMMDVEDEPMEDAASPVDETDAPEPEISKDDTQQDEEPNETVTVENGRRRGRRRVMKKKTVKDEEGYLVTREEPAWESFSEDEPAPKKIKVPSVSSVNTGSKGTAKKGAKPGQGNITSFFSKK